MDYHGKPRKSKATKETSYAPVIDAADYDAFMMDVNEYQALTCSSSDAMQAPPPTNPRTSRERARARARAERARAATTIYHNETNNKAPAQGYLGKSVRWVEGAFIDYANNVQGVSVTLPLPAQLICDFFDYITEPYDGCSLSSVKSAVVTALKYIDSEDWNRKQNLHLIKEKMRELKHDDRVNRPKKF